MTDHTASLVIGQSAPDFTLPRDGGGAITLSDLKGKTVVLYFYPRDDTPGCTTEALDFTAHASDFAALNAVVLGVSKDTIAKHDKFRDKHALSIALLSDADTTTCEDYGVWREKSMYGKVFMGIERSTFLIDTAGTLRKEWRKVKVRGHVDDVIGAIRALED